MGEVSGIWIMTGVVCFAAFCTAYGVLASSLLHWKTVARERRDERDAARGEAERLREELRREQAFHSAQLAALVKRQSDANA